MPKIKPIHIMLALSAASNLRTKIRAYKAAKLYLKAIEGYEETERAHIAQIEYLCKMLDKHGIEVTEFDLIALAYHND